MFCWVFILRAFKARWAFDGPYPGLTQKHIGPALEIMSFSWTPLDVGPMCFWVRPGSGPSKAHRALKARKIKTQQNILQWFLLSLALFFFLAEDAQFGTAWSTFEKVLKFPPPIFKIPLGGKCKMFVVFHNKPGDAPHQIVLQVRSFHSFLSHLVIFVIIMRFIYVARWLNHPPYNLKTTQIIKHSPTHQPEQFFHLLLWVSVVALAVSFIFFPTPSCF